jgi:vancomycin permeability regulator SanA
MNLRLLLAKGLTVALAANPITGLASNAWVLWRPRRRLYQDPEAIPPCPVAIVPGTRVSASGRPSRVLAHRLAAALELHQRGLVQTILASGVDVPGEREVKVMRAWLLQRGVPEEALLLDQRGVRTRATMQRARAVFGIERAVVCTQAFHLARAVLLGLRAGIDTVGLSVDQEDYQPTTYLQLREYLARQMAFVESYVIPTL